MLTQRVGDLHLLRLEPGEEAVTALRAWMEEQKVGCATVQAIGAFQRAVLAHFDPAARAYRHIPVTEQTEVVALSGNLSWGEEDQAVAHLHAVLSTADGHTLGGHLMEGVVQPALKVVITPQAERLRRRRDPASGLVLWDLSGPSPRPPKS